MGIVVIVEGRGLVVVVGGDGCCWLLVLVAVLVMVIVMLVAFNNKETIWVSSVGSKPLPMKL